MFVPIQALAAICFFGGVTSCTTETIHLPRTERIIQTEQIRYYDPGPRPSTPAVPAAQTPQGVHNPHSVSESAQDTPFVSGE